MQAFSFFFWLFVVGGGGDFGSGSGSKFNCAARVGSGWSDNLGYGPGSGFSFEPVQTSTIHCLKLDGCSLDSSSSVRNLGVLFDSNLSFDSHVSSICKTAFFSS